MVKSRYIGDGHPTFNRNPYNGNINPYYWVDDHPLLYGNNGSLDPGTHEVDVFHSHLSSHSTGIAPDMVFSAWISMGTKALCQSLHTTMQSPP